MESNGSLSKPLLLLGYTVDGVLVAAASFIVLSLHRKEHGLRSSRTDVVLGFDCRKLRVVLTADVNASIIEAQ